MTTTPSEEAIRASCAEAGVDPNVLGQDGYHWSTWQTILALARRIEAEQAAVPVKQRLYCETCGKDVPEVLCPTCAKWWDDNAPTTDRDRIAELEAALRFYANRPCNFEYGVVNECPYDDGETARKALKGTGNAT
jgi:hypothetical protein